jgi:ADP-ribose pyrophosphatase YjhB (NUDIX family)
MTQQKYIRVAVMALLVNEQGQVLLIFSQTGPDPHHWDLPGGGLGFEETLPDGLAREVTEETGLQPGDYQIDRLLLICENFFPDWGEHGLHSLSIVYQGTVRGEPTLSIHDTHEVVDVKWLNPTELSPEMCSKRSWQAFQEAGLV